MTTIALPLLDSVLKEVSRSRLQLLAEKPRLRVLVLSRNSVTRENRDRDPLGRVVFVTVGWKGLFAHHKSPFYEANAP